MTEVIELVQDKDSKTSFDSSHRYGYQIYKTALKKGLLLRPLGDILYFNPPLIMTREEMQKAVKICVDSIRKIMSTV